VVFLSLSLAAVAVVAVVAVILHFVYDLPTSGTLNHFKEIARVRG
jgi:hypothetical protein